VLVTPGGFRSQEEEGGRMGGCAIGRKWGITEYFHLDWMDDGMDGWKKLHDRDVLYI
jgi:hypothetical protein